jgi:hypothetical protein
MRTRTLAGVVAALAIVTWVQTSSGQVFPTPTAGSGVVAVTGRVDVGNVVPVDAAQRGEWRVAVTNSPTVAAVPLPFLKTGARVLVTWPGGAEETIQVLQLGGGGWVGIANGPRRRWINLDGARTVDEIP